MIVYDYLQTDMHIHGDYGLEPNTVSAFVGVVKFKSCKLEDVCVPPDVKPFLVPFRVATLPRSGTCA